MLRSAWLNHGRRFDRTTCAYYRSITTKPTSNTDERVSKPGVESPGSKHRKNAEPADFDPSSLQRDDVSWLYSPNLPISPIMDEAAWSARKSSAVTPPKSRKGHWDTLSLREKELLKNPYAAILASPIRQDFYFHLRLPSLTLQRVEWVSHPTTGKTWTLPSDLKPPSAESSGGNKAGPGRYVISSEKMLDYLSANTKRRGKVLATANFEKHAAMPVWRDDMGGFILKGLRDRVGWELGRVQKEGCLGSANRVGGKWEEGRVGCVLVWGEKAVEVSEPTDSAMESVDEPEPITKRAHPTVLVNGKEVAVYDMRFLLGGDEATQTLKDELKVEKTVYRSFIATSVKSVDALVWLWRLRGYVAD